MSLVRNFSTNITEEIQREIAKIIIGSYQGSIDFLNDSDLPKDAKKTRRTFLGFLRWMFIEMSAFKLREKFDNLTITEHPNANQHQAHVLISKNDSILTISNLKRNNVLPPKANFRNMYANQNPQMAFGFADEKSVLLDLNAVSTYGIAAHKANSSQLDFPEFIRIIFPNRNYTSIVAEVDLLKKFDDLIGNPHIQEEVIDDKSIPTLKKIVESKFA